LEAWYLEVAAGSFEEAARQYEAIYLTRPPGARASADRERAAYRAGCCYEALGKEGLAALAYDWLDRSGVEDSLLRRRAQARLRRLQEQHAGSSGSGSDSVSDGVRGDARQEALEAALSGSMLEVAAILESIEDDVRRWPEARRRLQGALIEKQLSAEAVKDLLDRLRRQGVELDFPAADSASVLKLGAVESEYAQRIGSLVPWKTVRSHMSRGFLVAGLRAAACRDASSARRCLSAALVLEPSLEEAREFLLRLDELSSPAALAALATSRLEEQQRLDVAILRQRLRGHLTRAAQEAAAQRRDRAVPELRDAWMAVELAPPAFLQDREIGELAERLYYEFVAAGGDTAQRFLEMAWSDAAGEARLFLDLAQEWIEHVHRDALRSQPPLVRSVFPPQEIIARELEQLARAVKKQAGAEGRRSDPRHLMVAQQLERLRGWFPDLAARS
ncbi:MAG: hypothetical protein JXA90_09670, partial [Planctomycetes bacterium]|nr:hypothetical protein [Planctomycetota bacterium]